MSSCLDPRGPFIPTVVLGEDAILDVKLKSKVTGDPFDLTAATEIKAILLNANNTYLEEKLSTGGGITLISGPGGHFQINLAAADTTLLAPSVPPALSDIEVQITIAGKLKIVLLNGAVNFIQRRFPAAP